MVSIDWFLHYLPFNELLLWKPLVFFRCAYGKSDRFVNVIFTRATLC